MWVFQTCRVAVTEDGILNHKYQCSSLGQFCWSLLLLYSFYYVIFMFLYPPTPRNKQTTRLLYCWPINIQPRFKGSPNQHAGIIHLNLNLCSEYSKNSPRYNTYIVLWGYLMQTFCTLLERSLCTNVRSTAGFV